MASAAEHAHCNTTVESALILPEGKAMTSHVKIVEPWESEKPIQIPALSESDRTQKGGAQRALLHVGLC